MRTMAQTGAFEFGFMKLPQQAPWIDTLIKELKLFREENLTIRLTQVRKS